jgi:mRNA interferase HicA
MEDILIKYRDIMKGSEFLRKLKNLGKEKGIKVKLIEERGKGSHCTIEFGNRFTIIRNLKDELKTGTFNAMLKQLGISKNELR